MQCHLIIISIFNTILAYNHPNHFGNPCYQCNCFVMYTDRDKDLTVSPYGVVEEPYQLTEDQCLTMCLNDERCGSVVYGLVGGRNVFACEFYEDAGTRNLVYVPFVNTYLPQSHRCKAHPSNWGNVKVIENAGPVRTRKMNYLSVKNEKNPFNFGR